MTTPVTLLVDPLRGFHVWNITELYMGPSGTSSGTIVPNVDDEVTDWNNGKYRVIAVDSATYTPTLQLVDFSALALDNGNLGLPKQSVLELAYLNTQVTPYTISIDDWYRSYESAANYCMLFKGTDVTTTGTVISQVYNGSGVLISEQVPLEMADTTNPAIKRPPIFNTNIALSDGETVTLVNYTASGGVTGIHDFRIKNTNMVRGLGNSSLYITDVVLVSPLLDPSVVDLINIPANVPITASSFQAKLLYNNGSTVLITIDNIKTKLFGLANFNTSQAGIVSTAVLTYYPAANEATISSSNPSVPSISHVYTVHTVNNVLENSFKIYVIPSFNVSTNTFSLQYYLTNLSYNIGILLNSAQMAVTTGSGLAVNYAVNTDAQELILSVPLTNIFPAGGYAGFTFVQSVTVQFGNPLTTPWILDYLNNGTQVYGVNMTAAYSLSNIVNIGGSYAATLNTSGWLASIYSAMHPIYDSTTVLAPPTPTHFTLILGGVTSSVIRDIASYWYMNLPNDFGSSWTADSTLTVVLQQQDSLDPTVYHILGYAPLLLVNTLT